MRSLTADPAATHPPRADGGLPAAGDAVLCRVLHDLLAVLDADAAAGWAAMLAAEFGSMARLAAASPRRLAALVGPRAAALLDAHRRASLASLRETALQGPVIATRYELLDYLHHAQAAEPTERLRLLFLDARRELIAEEVVAGEGAAIAVQPRDVIARALEHGARGLILVHNHPGGDPAPSVADRAFTARLTRAAALFDIRVHDHLVIARGGHARVPVEAVADRASHGEAGDGVIDP